MAIARPTPGWSYDEFSTIVSAVNPYGGSAVSSNTSYNQQTQYNIHNLPDRLRGMQIDQCLKTVYHTIDEVLFNQMGNDQSFRNSIKKTISDHIAEEVFKITPFTHIREPIMGQVKVIGRVVIMTEDQLNKLIQMVR